MKTEHTPVPWEIREMTPSSIGYATWEITDGIDRPIAFVSEPQPRSRDEMAANARLIAAAPDLLDALLACRSAGILSVPAYEKTNAAIAKATGKEEA